MTNKNYFKRLWSILTVMMFAFVFGAASVMAAIYPSVKGTVVDESGEPVIGASILVIGKQNLYFPNPNTAIQANTGAALFQNFGYSGYDASIPMWTNANANDAEADELK